MNPQDPLANLHPLRQPDIIGWWPLAPGWWLLLALGIALILALVVVLVRRYRRNAYRRQALSQLQLLHQNYLADGDAGKFLSTTNALLKSAALVAYPRRQVASSSGEQWLQFLNSGLRGNMGFEAEFVNAAYRSNCPQLDLEQAHRCAVAWIKQHEVQR